MTRRKKTRSLADKVSIRTGKRKDYRRWRHENPDEVTSSRRYVSKKDQQRKAQAERKLKRQSVAPLPLHKADNSDKDTD
ncbi:hypothetical protein QO259_07620 [Salinicola sp. JS01]|uniref:hypothetical protein n=1 Tax=Salinicola sp. JS01 TaxID=3050071 RepID=UPI0004E667B1|nr:hypothetical protein [Salinicola sp. JS01]KFF50487.1 hypothetical protein GY26_02045 [Gammaproteobacteria bacterium MFB021]WIX34506.1 hypothetical protein QO259_07620 [Salinicola sp. JS01]